jgi:NADH dehydrogenase
MATIGRSRAVAVVGGTQLSGHVAWWAWLLVHIVMLIGFRNRLVVLVNWAWNYLTYDRGLRAIVGAPDVALLRTPRREPVDGHAAGGTGGPG